MHDGVRGECYIIWVGFTPFKVYIYDPRRGGKMHVSAFVYLQLGAQTFISLSRVQFEFGT
jgi:hypothetical protein